MTTLKLEKQTWKSFERQMLPEGMVDAICYSIVDLGTQESTWEWNIIRQRKIQVTFETDVMGDFDWEKKPLVIGKRYTFSSNEKSRLSIDLKSWLWKQVEEWFDVMSLLWKSAKLQIINNTAKDGKVYQNINTIIPSDKEWELINQRVAYSLDAHDDWEFEKIPEWMRDIIIKSPEWDKLSYKEDNSDLPF